MSNTIVAAQHERSTFRRVFHAATTVALFSIAVKLAATAKEFVLAGVYGRSDAMDAYLAAALIPNLLINLFAESMNQALIPTLVRVRLQQGAAQAQKLLAHSMMRLVLLLTSASVAMAVLAPVAFPLIASNFAAPKLEFSIHIFWALLPVVLLAGVASNCTAVLNTMDRFAIPALAPTLMPLGIIASALLFGQQYGVWAVVCGNLLGVAAYAALMAWMMNGHGYRFALSWGGESQAAREVARQYGPVLLSSVVASGGLLADQAMAAMLPPGSVSALVYAGRFTSVVVTLLAGALASALTPHFSVLVANADWSGCRRSLRHWAGITALVSVPIAIVLIAGAPSLVRLTLQHGVFTARDTAVVTPVMVMYAVQIPFFAVSRVYYRFVLAMRRTDLILYCGIINLVLDIVLNLVLMRWMGLAGIALATSLWTASTLAFLWYWSYRLLKQRLHVTAPTRKDGRDS
ncbi:murein biosynthesis integral membrane protein MurJ [Terracidiphilus gabretensis]|uniref:murein biosynthesis integral membrane protein MurJ n=1 Tax=Terracidiphilus gabretensis TaxID=1577687 RepID=UPI00071B75B4|nr:lipid II flippase MurJ [Terracidiphilus gabretensis]